MTLSRLEEGFAQEVRKVKRTLGITLYSARLVVLRMYLDDPALKPEDKVWLEKRGREIEAQHKEGRKKRRKGDSIDEILENL